MDSTDSAKFVTRYSGRSGRFSNELDKVAFVIIGVYSRRSPKRASCLKNKLYGDFRSLDADLSCESRDRFMYISGRSVGINQMNHDAWRQRQQHLSPSVMPNLEVTVRPNAREDVGGESSDASLNRWCTRPRRIRNISVGQCPGIRRIAKLLSRAESKASSVAGCW